MYFHLLILCYCYYKAFALQFTYQHTTKLHGLVKIIKKSFDYSIIFIFLRLIAINNRSVSINHMIH